MALHRPICCRLGVQGGSFGSCWSLTKDELPGESLGLWEGKSWKGLCSLSSVCPLAHWVCNFTLQCMCHRTESMALINHRTETLKLWAQTKMFRIFCYCNRKMTSVRSGGRSGVTLQRSSVISVTPEELPDWWSSTGHLTGHNSSALLSTEGTGIYWGQTDHLPEHSLTFTDFPALEKSVS